MKTRINIDNKETEGVLRESRFYLAKGKTWRDVPSNDASLDKDEIDNILSVGPLTIHVLRFIVEDGTWIFNILEWGKHQDSQFIPHTFNTFAYQEGDNEAEECGDFFDDNAEKLYTANYAKRPHAIKEQKLWQRENRHVGPTPKKEGLRQEFKTLATDAARKALEENAKAAREERSRNASIAAKRHGHKGGRKFEDPENVLKAIKDILNQFRNNPFRQMKAACIAAKKDYHLPQGWEAVRKHVKKCVIKRGRKYIVIKTPK